MKKLTIIAFSVLTALNSAHAEPRPAGTEMILDRYTTVKAAPTKAQGSLLSVIVQFNFPKSVLTVGDAFEYALSRSGYHLNELSLQQPGMVLLMQQPLPKVHRKMGPVTLRDALVALAGIAYDIQVNDLMRTVSFDVKDNYKAQLAEAIKGMPVRHTPDNKHRRFIRVSNELKPAMTSAVAQASEAGAEAIKVSNQTGTEEQYSEEKFPAYDIEKSEKQAEKVEFEGADLTVVDTTQKPYIIPASPFVPIVGELRGAQYSESELTYGPVQEKEILWGIAETVRPDSRFTIPQVMMAIRDMNPGAFKDGNINEMYKDVVLKIPTEDQIAAHSKKQALNSTINQYEQWKLNKETAN